jgi:hypothetical protein
VCSFQSDSRIRLALMSIKAAGVGLTLTAADTVVFAELDWNPTDLMQCEDRIHRVGQKQHCRVYYCVAAGSADSLMWGTLLRKLRVVGATVDGVSDAQGLGSMQYWQQVGSQQSAGAGGEARQAPASQQNRTRDAAAAAGGDASAAAAAAGSDGGPSQFGGDKTARRSLFGEFLATGRMPGEGHASGNGSGLVGGSAVTGSGAPGSAGEADAAGSQGERSAQARNNTQGTASAAAMAGANGSAEQGVGADGLTPPETNDCVLIDVDADEASGATHPAAGTQGSRSLLQAGDALAVNAAGGSSSQRQQGQLVSAGRMVAVCAAASGAQGAVHAEGVEATGSAPDAPVGGSPADDLPAKRQRQG